MTRPATANYKTPVKPGDDVMTVEEYLEAGFVDYDGMGEPVKDGKIAEPEYNPKTGWPDWLKPSDGDSKIPQDATHIIWYNR